MARSDRDAARFQTQFLTNRDVAGTSDAYSLLVHEDGALTRYRYALLAILFAVNLFISVAVLVLAVLKQPAPSDVHWEAVSAMTNDSQEWMTCRRYYATDSKRTRQDCAVINDRFCHAASKVSGRQLSCAPAEFSEKSTWSVSVDERVDRTGWYAIYSSVRWNPCVSRWYHHIYAAHQLITNSSRSSSSRACSHSSHVVVAALLKDSLAIRTSPATAGHRTQIRTVLQRIG